jgi:hypothetical protein
LAPQVSTLAKDMVRNELALNLAVARPSAGMDTKQIADAISRQTESINGRLERLERGFSSSSKVAIQLEGDADGLLRKAQSRGRAIAIHRGGR